MRTEGSIEIDRAVADVFRLTTEDVTQWSDVVSEEIMEPGSPQGVGARFRTITEEGGHKMEFDSLVTEHDPPHRTRIEMTGKMFDLDVVYLFVDLGSATRVTQVSVVKAKGMMKVVFFCCGWMMKKSSRRALQGEFERLKAYCEKTQAASEDSC